MRCASVVPALPALPHLKTLSIDRRCDKIKAVHLVALTRLTALDLYCCRFSVPLQACAFLPHLALLDLSDACPDNSDMTVLRHCTSLTFLALDHCQWHCVDSAILGSLTRLQYLSVRVCTVSGFGFLSSLTNLTNLRLGNTHVMGNPVGPTPLELDRYLTRLSQLTALSIDETPILPQTVLKLATQLRSLELGPSRRYNESGGYTMQSFGIETLERNENNERALLSHVRLIHGPIVLATKGLPQNLCDLRLEWKDKRRALFDFRGWSVPLTPHYFNTDPGSPSFFV
jgi:hypothetical protein